MPSITYRLVKGAPITSQEYDDSLHNLDDRMVDVEGMLDATSDGPRFVDFIEQVGNTLIVHYTDGTHDGPFDLGTLSLGFRGEWEPDTSYVVNDVFTANGSTYIVLISHQSDPDEFDPNATSGSSDLYGLLLTNPANVIPVGGGTGYRLTKLSDDDYDIYWAPPVDETAFGATVETIDDVLYVLTEAASGLYLRFTNPLGCEIVCPSDDTEDIVVGAEWHCRAAGGPLMFTAEDDSDSDSDNDVVINPQQEGFETTVTIVGTNITVKKVDANEFDLIGPPGEEESS